MWVYSPGVTKLAQPIKDDPLIVFKHFWQSVTQQRHVSQKFNDQQFIDQL